MIQKAKVTKIGLRRGKHLFVVAGYADQLGYFPYHRKRTFKQYAQACRYSIELRDYYQVPISEY
jgi:hypothetical protein